MGRSYREAPPARPTANLAHLHLKEQHENAEPNNQQRSDAHNAPIKL
jgi:hypothetical protein